MAKVSIIMAKEDLLIMFKLNIARLFYLAYYDLSYSLTLIQKY